MDSPPSTNVFYTDVGVVPEHDNDALEPTILSLQAEISDLRSKQKSLYAHRKEALNKLLDIKGSIRVFCRVGSSRCSSGKPSLQSPVSFAEERITVSSVGGVRKDFGADRLFAPDSTQEDVFREVEPVLRSALDGNNVCVFAYGQTGTGKTFTMEGTDEQPEIVPRSIEELFRRASEDESASVGFSMSMLEVYMGSLRDLFARATRSAPPKSVLNILTGRNGSVEVEGLADVSVADFKQARRWYAKGKRARSTSWTNVNEASSRSHCLTRITVSRSGAVSKVWMVDLGGSERLLKTGATGQTLDEGRAINLSLSALADVIASLRKKRHHIPYRNSKLTQILSDSLGDGSKVLMIVHVSPSEGDVAETICSLNFAKRVRAIESNRELSEDTKKQKEKRIADLNRQIDNDAAELQKVRNHIERAEKLIREKKLEDHKGSLIVDRGEITETPRNSEKTARRVRTSSVPHFMTSTESSRQRLSACGEVNRRARTSPMLVLSQSLSYSEPCFKPNPRRPTSKIAGCEADSPTCNSINAKSSSFRNAKVSTSHPILRLTLQHHRRRMSNLT